MTELVHAYLCYRGRGSLYEGVFRIIEWGQHGGAGFRGVASVPVQKGPPL